MDKIFGVITHSNELGVQAYAVLEDGTVIDSHFCSSEGFAKSDLGFSQPLRQYEPFSEETHSTVAFNDERHKKYAEMFPGGFELVWLGFDHDIEVKTEEYAERSHLRFK